MRIDPAILSILAMSVTSLTGIMLVLAWRQMPEIGALAWWGSAFLATALGLGALAAKFLLSPAIPVAAACIGVCLGGGLLWAGCRAFERRSVPPEGVLVGAVLWLAAYGIPEVYKSPGLGLGVGSALFCAYGLAGAAELWRGRRERLGSRIPVAILLAIHALVLASLVPQTIGGGDLKGFAAERLCAHAIEGLVFAIAAALLFVGLAGERRRAGGTDAELDPATRALTRDAFLARGRTFLDAARRDTRACVLLHARLEVFCPHTETAEPPEEELATLRAVMRRALPVDAIIGRIGPDEIACLLGAPEEAAWGIAERIRGGFEAKCSAASCEPLTSVAIGIVTTAEAGHVLHALLAVADLALVHAEFDGGNRVARLEGPDLVMPESWSVEGLVSA